MHPINPVQFDAFKALPLPVTPVDSDESLTVAKIPAPEPGQTKLNHADDEAAA
jgi:hypothetical protein